MDVQAVTEASALRWLAEGRPFVAATLVEVLGSAPLPVGATMLVDGELSIEGSVTGGCVEAALVEEAARVLAGGPPRVVTYGISDELAGDVGLTCGGTVRVLVAGLTPEVAPVVAAALAAVQQRRPVAVATLLDGPSTAQKLALVGGEVVGGLGATALLDASVARDAAGLLQAGVSMIRRYAADGATMGADLRVFVQSYARAPRMVIFGANDFSAALAPLGRDLGYRVTICDARPAFAASGRFASAAEVVVDWPDRYLATQVLDERDVVLIFTHDPKFDVPALRAALATPAGYIGALGSRRTQDHRRHRLAEAGVTDDEASRIAGPCGLDIGPSTPMETAVSIVAEIVARRGGRAGAPLEETCGAIRGAAGSPVR